MKILLVDDSGMMRVLQKRCLLKLGVAPDDIVEAENGQVALDAFASETFDIIMTDQNMPVMDGLTFVKEVRTTNKDIPIVMITTDSERSRVISAIEAGVSDYLVKPFTPDDLRTKVRKWVPLNV
jgi:two-component system, chemotaxis family, chemotaxis protein CheY